VSDIVSFEEQPERVLPPSQQQQRNFGFYERIVSEDAERTLRFNRDPLSIAGDERPATMTAKIVLSHYLHHKKTIGKAKSTHYGERRCADGIRRLLSGHDFCMDVELSAHRALKRKPILLLAFFVLFQRETADAGVFAEQSPGAFAKLLTIIGAELRRRNIKAVGTYLNRPTCGAR
jgi:hypothetical protein